MGKKHIVLVTGGQRSGKSGYAQKLALSLTANPVYLATSRVWDEEFRERVLRHQADRGTGMDEYRRREIPEPPRSERPCGRYRLCHPLGYKLFLRQ